MTLNLNIDKLGGPGRKAAPLEIGDVRPLGEAQIAQLEFADGPPMPPQSLKRITDRHHALARLLAGGMSEGEAAITLSFDPSRVSVIKASPAFQELLALYRAEVDREFASMLDNMAGLGKDVIMELRERVEEQPEKLSNRELLDIGTNMADRVDIGESNGKLPTVIELIAHEVPASSGEAARQPTDPADAPLSSVSGSVPDE